MARSNGHNGQGPALPHWQAEPQLPAGQAPHAPHALHQGQHAPQQGFVPSPDLPFPQHLHAPQQPLAGYAPAPRTQPPAAPGYDLGQYGHGQQGTPMPPPVQPFPAPQAHAHHPQYQHPTHAPPHMQPGLGQPPQGGAHWGHAQAEPHLPSPAAFAEPVPGNRTGVPTGHGQHFGHLAPPTARPAGPAPSAHAAAPHATHEPADEDYEDEYEDEEEPKRGRKLMVVGALVGAICVGAGLAYAYRAFSGGKPIATAAKVQPQKTAAAPQAAPKPPVKLPDAVPAQVASAATADDGVRRVQSITIPSPGAAPAPPPAAPSTGAAVIPGLIVEGLPRPQQAPAAPPAAAPAAPLRPSTVAVAPPVPSPAPVPPPAQPAPPPAKVAVVNPPASPAPAPAPERKAAPVPKKTNDAYNPGAPAPTTTASTPPAAAPAQKAAAPAGSNGYVATILSTQKGRPAAMQAFADLQQKFPNVLGAKPAEVQEKDLGDKGIWYRAVVGPPGSRAAAAEVCTQLKASGYGQCFVTAY